MQQTTAPAMDYRDTAKRLRAASHKLGPAEQDLATDAARVIDALLLTNRELHRRAQIAESPLQAKVAKLEAENAHSLAWALSSFNRLVAAHSEVKRIYEECRKAYDDGCDGYGYHSVNDMRFDGQKADAGAVWANVYRSRFGGIVTVRPLDVVRGLICELLERRKQDQK